MIVFKNIVASIFKRKRVPWQVFKAELPFVQIVMTWLFDHSKELIKVCLKF